MIYTGISNKTLKMIIIILASVHLLISSIVLYLVQTDVELSSDALSGILIVSIIACLLIIMLCVDWESTELI